MKSYTDIEQSRRLAEILPIESADMGWNVFVDGSIRCLPIGDWDLSKNGEGGAEFIPCWSLSALLYVLPNNEHISTILSRGGWKIESIEYVDKWCCEYEDDNDTKDFLVSADNPIDACYEMIVKLKEIKLL